MSQALVAITYTYKHCKKEQISISQNETAGTGRKFWTETTRTIVAPSYLAQEFLDLDIAQIKKYSATKKVEMLGEPEIRNIAMNYPVPHYWG